MAQTVLRLMKPELSGLLVLSVSFYSLNLPRIHGRLVMYKTVVTALIFDKPTELQPLTRLFKKEQNK